MVKINRIWFLAKETNKLNSLELGGLRFHGDGEAQDSRGVPAGGVDVIAAGRKEAVKCDQLIYRDGRMQRTSGEESTFINNCS